MIDVKDEILEEEPKYRIRDKDGNILFDDLTIEITTKVIQEPTPLNKALFDSIKNDIDNLGAFEYNQDLSVTCTTPTTSWSSWSSVYKAEPIIITLPENRRFLFVRAKGTGSNVLHNFFLLIDTIEKKIYEIYISNTTFNVSGSGISETNPTMYVVESYESSGSTCARLVLAITNYNIETKQLTIVPAIYSKSNYVSGVCTGPWKAHLTVSELLSKGV